MSPTLPPQQALINDPLALQELMSLDGGRGISVPGQLNALLLERLQRELAGIGDGGDGAGGDPEAIAGLPCLNAVVQEVLRIHPVAMQMFPRLVENPTDPGGPCPAAGRCAARRRPGA